ncbi:MAG: nitrile hydratase subunit beta [Trebonia sp.]
MKLQHALGGLEGLDEAPLDLEKRVFVADWERRIFGIHAAMMGLSSSLRDAVPGYDLTAVPTTFETVWTWADLRKRAEAMHPFEYFKLRYYEKWLGGISAYLVENGYLTEDELSTLSGRYRAEPAAPLPARRDDAIDQQVLRYLREGDTPRRGPAAPAFKVGDQVVVKDPPRGEHTRLPGYLRGRTGRAIRVFEGNYAYFCSTGADGLGTPMPVYVVRFEPDELWGPAAEPSAGPQYAEIYEVYLATAKDEN